MTRNIHVNYPHLNIPPGLDWPVSVDRARPGTVVVHIQARGNPRKSLCDPTGDDRGDIHPDHHEVSGDVEWCPECLQAFAVCRRDAARALGRQSAPGGIRRDDPDVIEY